MFLFSPVLPIFEGPEHTLVTDNRHPSKRLRILLTLSLLAASEALYLLLHTSVADRIVLFVVVSLACSGLYAACWLLLRRWDPVQPWFLPALIIIAGLAFRITVLSVSPTASDDINRYLWDGRVQANGIDPYRFEPADSSLRHLRDAHLPSQVNFPEMKTIYPPLAEWIFLAANLIGPSSHLAMKLLLLCGEGATMILLLLGLQRNRLPVAHLSLYALCPLPILHFMIDGHVDGFAIPFFVLALLFWTSGKRLSGGVALGASIATKVLPVIFIPSFWSDTRGRERILATAVPIGVAAGFYVPYLLMGSNPFESLGVFSMNWEANSSLFRLIQEMVGNNQTAHHLSNALIAMWMVFIATRNRPLAQKVYWSLLGFFLLASTVHPWYLAWLAALLPFTPRWSGIAYVTLGNLAGITVIHYQLGGVWHQPTWALLLEYLPVYLLTGWEFRTFLRENNGP